MTPMTSVMGMQRVKRTIERREELTNTAMDTRGVVGVVADLGAVEADLGQTAEAEARAGAGAADENTTMTTIPMGVTVAMVAEAAEAMTGVTAATAIDMVVGTTVVGTMVATTDTTPKEREAPSLTVAPSLAAAKQTSYSFLTLNSEWKYCSY